MSADKQLRDTANFQLLYNVVRQYFLSLKTQCRSSLLPSFGEQGDGWSKAA